MNDRLTKRFRRDHLAQVDDDDELAARLENERDNDVHVGEDDAALAQRMQLDEYNIVQDDENENEENTETESFSNVPMYALCQT